MNNEYKMMKNLIHNDYKISKKDIEKIVVDEVKNAVKKIDLETLINKEVLVKLCNTNAWGGLSYETKQVLENTNEFLDSAVQKAIKQTINENIIIQFKDSAINDQ